MRGHAPCTPTCKGGAVMIYTMAKKISKRTIERILECAKIEEVVGDYVDLTKKGVRYLGLCPFHEDRHQGNFVVYPPKGVYRCFACDARGDSVDFLMRHLKVDFMEAVRVLGKKYNIETDGMPVNVTLPPPRPKPEPLPMLSLPMEMVTAREDTTGDVLCWWMGSLPWDGAQRARVPKVLSEYHVGYSPKHGMTIFWQIDDRERVRTGKMMRYKTDGHRDTSGGNRVNWIHSYIFHERYGGLSESLYEVRQCLFGLHLLDKYPNAEVHIVESEKTALIMAIAYGNNYKTVWMACGGKQNLTRERLAVLMSNGRRIVLHPDHDGIEEWKEIRKGLKYDRVTVDVNIVSEPCWKPEDGEKADMADVIVRMLKENAGDRIEPVQILIDNLKLEYDRTAEG